jgi:hypothetical protein
MGMMSKCLIPQFVPFGKETNALQSHVLVLCAEPERSAPIHSAGAVEVIVEFYEYLKAFSTFSDASLELVVVFAVLMTVLDWREYIMP